MALIVLGAGATRGASFVDGGGACLPPLDGDFFTQLQRITTPKHQATIDGVLEDVVQLFGHNFRVTLETMFTTIEHTLRVVNATKQVASWRKSKLEAMRTRLQQAIAAVLEEALTAEGRDHKECSYHTALVKRLSVQKEDAIISFNYDCLIDAMLRLHGESKWNARYGYGLPMPKGKGSHISGEQHWSPKAARQPTRTNTVRLLKLHGSIHFRAEAQDRFALKERPYTRQHGNLRFEIIPPEWNKHFDEGVFRKLWNTARDDIHKASTIVVIGYSFPLTDLHTSALFRVSVGKEKLKRLVIVNPDPEARRRTRDVLMRGFGGKTRVLVFDSFKEFSQVKRSMWDA